MNTTVRVMLAQLVGVLWISTGCAHDIVIKIIVTKYEIRKVQCGATALPWCALVRCIVRYSTLGPVQDSGSDGDGDGDGTKY
jgi:hypothetical protein